MKHNLLLITLLSFSFCAQAQVDESVTVDKNVKSNVDYIDPLIGNVGHLLVPTRPTVQVPHQMIRMYPLRADYVSDQISTFPLNVISHRLGEVFSVKPSVNLTGEENWKEPLTYDHDLEITRPWYYSTYLVDKEIKVEFAPGAKVGVYRFSFPKSSPKAILFGNYNRGNSAYKMISDRLITGLETYHGNIKVYLYGEFSIPGKLEVISSGQLVSKNEINGETVKAAVVFDKTASQNVEFRYALSYVSSDQAIKNFNKEIKNISFNALSAKAENSWKKVIDQIQVEGGTESQRRSFYTSLYRCYERMVNISEDSFYYSGYDQQIHKDNTPFYVDDWSWDTYLALHPLRTILNPDLENQMLQSYVKMYEQSGWMPTFPVLFGDHACMNGFHSSVTFLDAYRKGLKGFDIQKAFQGSLKNAEEATLLPWRNGPKDSLTMFYHQNGYLPALKKQEKETVALVDKFEKRQAVAVTLGASYDDWAVAQLAKDLNKTTEFNKYSKRADNYKTLWNKDKQFFMPKDDKGNWIDIDPAIDGGMGGRDYYDENNGWTYMWQTQHDIPGLISLMGGEKAFETRLDLLFRKGLSRSKYEFWSEFPDATGLVGQFSMGNEPSFHIPYLYNYAGAPWKTQKKIRFLLDLWFKDNVFGIPGDEDGGGMTAFVVFSSMGFYPVTPGLPVYSIGSPVFSKITISLPNNKKFTLIANKCSVQNKYIQSAKMNGKVLNDPTFTHEQLINGGTLELEMGPLPNKTWGSLKSF